MWLIDFNNVAIEKIQPDTKPTSCAYTHTYTCTHVYMCIIYVWVSECGSLEQFIFIFVWQVA